MIISTSESTSLTKVSEVVYPKLASERASASTLLALDYLFTKRALLTEAQYGNLPRQQDHALQKNTKSHRDTLRRHAIF